MKRTIRMLWLCLLVAFLFPVQLAAQSKDRAEKFTFREEKNLGYQLRADTFSYDERQDIYTASGNVILHTKDRVIFADHVRLDGATKEAI